MILFMMLESGQLTKCKLNQAWKSPNARESTNIPQNY